ncbi:MULTISPECIES: cytochrome c biogenesis CcdA family protein [Kamptonema]|uniref:cytochrome c biogenesis CcdA family protein n=1 Tax=Kamptonema TaxID=1501433 RepID=UPI0001DACF08|nr:MULTISPECIES: cytochrome c biogenesis protein CcdA [Kamptonema]CBN56388.1 Cytochrome c biogenesis protein, transmembrane region [Kamptonema sp. PCC 6506]
MATSLPSTGVALLAGFLTILSPCILPILPLLLGRSLQSHRYGPVALVLGLITGFAAIGSLLGVTSTWFVSLASVLRNGAIAFLLMAGVSTIFPQIYQLVFKYLHFQRWLKEPVRVGLMGEFWLGTQLGLLWTPCAGPVLASILVIAVVNPQPTTTFVLLVLYGLGAGLPLLAIAYGGRYFSQNLLRLRPHSAALQRIGGVIVVLSAIAIILGWDVKIQLWLAPFFPTLPL